MRWIEKWTEGDFLCLVIKQNWRFQWRFLSNATKSKRFVIQLSQIIEFVCSDRSVGYIIGKVVFEKPEFAITANIHDMLFSVEMWCLLIFLEREISLERFWFFTELKNVYWEMRWVEIWQNDPKWCIGCIIFNNNWRNPKGERAKSLGEPKIFFFTILRLLSNPLWLRASWRLQMDRKQRIGTFFVNKTWRFWKVKLMIHTKIQILFQSNFQRQDFLKSENNYVLNIAV